MPWVRIDDGYADHPKVAAVGPLGQALWFAGLAYCNRNLTDGFIPYSVGLRLVTWSFLDESGQTFVYVGGGGFPQDDPVTSEYVIELLIQAKLWEQVPGGYRVHDYADYQPTKAQVIAEREQKQAAGRAGGQAAAKARATAPAKANGAAPADAPAQAEFKPVPVPVPVPVPSTGNPRSDPAPRKQRPTSTADILKGFDLRDISDDTRLTRAQLDAWSSFGSEWDRFKAAWFARGLKWPPSGSPEDDPEAASPSQRALLYSILDSRPTDLPRWVAEAPGKTAASIVGYVLSSWHSIRDAVPADRQH